MYSHEHTFNGVVTNTGILPGMIASHTLWVDRHRALRAHVGGTPLAVPTSAELTCSLTRPVIPSIPPYVVPGRAEHRQRPNTGLCRGGAVHGDGLQHVLPDELQQRYVVSQHPVHQPGVDYRRVDSPVEQRPPPLL